MEKTRRPQIGVIGPDMGEYPRGRKARNKISCAARKLGELVAKSGGILFTGGCKGVMEEASIGAKLAGGITAGMPGNCRNASNRYVDIEIVTGVDVGSFIFAGILSCDALIVIPGGAGTLSELCIAYRSKKPCIIMSGFSKQYDSFIGGYLDSSKAVRILGATAPEDAVEAAFKAANNNIKYIKCK